MQDFVYTGPLPSRLQTFQTKSYVSKPMCQAEPSSEPPASRKHMAAKKQQQRFTLGCLICFHVGAFMVAAAGLEGARAGLVREFRTSPHLLIDIR